MALINKLTEIADAIREKTGTSDLLTLDEMPTLIASITTGSGGGVELPEGIFNYSGNCNNLFYNGNWDWILQMFGDEITTNNIVSASQMFYKAGKNIGELPFDINFNAGGCDCNSMFKQSEFTKLPSIDFKQTKYQTCDSLFQEMQHVTEIGTIKNLYPSALSQMFRTCTRLRYLPEFENLTLNRIYTYNYSNCGSMFYNCHSLRRIPEELLNILYTPLVTSQSYAIFQSGFNSCYTLDELKGLNPQTGAMTTNMFNGCFSNCYRVKDIIFKLQNDETPYVCNWKSQTIDLTSYVGWAMDNEKVINYNSGITLDKEVTDIDRYTALKNDPDWFTCDARYSRYNHDSAVNTINTLPDVTQGSSNVIKFVGHAGSLTDGGAINTLTEEEIAVAAAKGWTVTLT